MGDARDIRGVRVPHLTFISSRVLARTPRFPKWIAGWQVRSRTSLPTATLEKKDVDALPTPAFKLGVIHVKLTMLPWLFDGDMYTAEVVLRIT